METLLPYFNIGTVLTFIQPNSTTGVLMEALQYLPWTVMIAKVGRFQLQSTSRKDSSPLLYPVVARESSAIRVIQQLLHIVGKIEIDDDRSSKLRMAEAESGGVQCLTIHA